MTLRDRYKKLKKKYPNGVVLIKSGSFYNTYEDDAILIHELLGYRLVNKRVGFPIYNLYKINVLQNYVLVDNYALIEVCS